MKPLALCLLLPLLLSGFSAAQDSDSVKLLNCTIAGGIPEVPAQAAQGGYLLEYQSLRGTTEDARACTVYRLRNAPGKPPTPLRWTLGEEVVVDKVRLARCDGEAACPWMTVVKYFAGEIDTNLSTLSYGLNADAYHEQVSTFMATFGVRGSEVAEAQALLASSVGTEIEGVFATRAGESVALHLIVKSRFEPDPGGGVTLIYEVDDLLGGGALGSGELRLVWDALAAVPAVAALLDEAARAPSGAEPLELTSGGGTLSRSSDALRIAVPAGRFVLDETFTLAVYARDDEEPLATVAMPAYMPLEAP